jgi:hypothetical protein
MFVVFSLRITYGSARPTVDHQPAPHGPHTETNLFISPSIDVLQTFKIPHFNNSHIKLNATPSSRVDG